MGSLSSDKAKRVFVSLQQIDKETEGALGSWCFVQRKAHKKGELSEERIRSWKPSGFRFES